MCREFKIRLRRDTELFTDDFTVDNADFDPAKVVTGDVEGKMHVYLTLSPPRGLPLTSKIVWH